MRTIHPVLTATVLGLSILGLTRGAWSAGPVSEAWTSRYNGPGNFEDVALALALDSSGNPVVTGYSYGPGSAEDFLTVKYDGNTGEQLWATRYNGPGNGGDIGTGVAVDGSGDVLITGYSYGGASSYEYATVKYDGATGDQLWVARYNGPGNAGDVANALALDSAGNPVVTGYSNGGGSGNDYATVKYNGSTGAELWLSRYNGTASADDRGYSVAVDSDGQVVVTGSSAGPGTGGDAATIKYNGGTGTELWTARYNGAANGADAGNSLAVDPANDILVAGPSEGIGTGSDYFTRKYDGATGAVEWSSFYNGAANGGDYASKVAVDLAGNVIVTGQSDGAGSGEDFATVKYDGNSGAQHWAVRYNGPGNGNDQANRLAVDGAGNVVVTGISTGSGTGADIETQKYNGTTGAELWSARYSGPGNGGDFGLGLAIDGFGDVLVTGRSLGSGSNLDYTTLKYVEDAHADNVTSLCLVTRGGLRKSLATGRYSQVVTVRNTSASTVTGPISLALDSLSPTATLFNKTGDTVYTSPTGSPYRNSAASLAPGASAAITLEFTNPTNVRIGWTGRVLAGPSAR